MVRHMHYVWQTYTQTEQYARVLLGGHALANVEVLQRINDNACIVRYDERFHGDTINIHVLYLLFRIETDHGFIIYLRPIDLPAVRAASTATTDCWTSDSVWLRWDLPPGTRKEDVDLHGTKYTMSIGGSLTGDDVSYASRWVFEAFAALIRAEMEVLGHRFLAI